jgi:hypothetical protein
MRCRQKVYDALSVRNYPASLHPGDGVFHADSKLRQLAVDVFLGGR